MHSPFVRAGPSHQRTRKDGCTCSARATPRVSAAGPPRERCYQHLPEICPKAWDKARRGGQGQGVVGGLGTAVPGPLPRAAQAAQTPGGVKPLCPQGPEYLIRRNDPGTLGALRQPLPREKPRLPSGGRGVTVPVAWCRFIAGPGPPPDGSPACAVFPAASVAGLRE